jgi:hypothetical protein
MVVLALSVAGALVVVRGLRVVGKRGGGVVVLAVNNRRLSGRDTAFGYILLPSFQMMSRTPHDLASACRMTSSGDKKTYCNF